MNTVDELEKFGITDVKGALEIAFISGFNSSREGCNGEYNILGEKV